MPANPTNNPQWAPGYAAKLAFQFVTLTVSGPPTLGNSTYVNVTGWDKSLKVDSVDTTSTGSGGIEERIAALLRGTFSFTLNFDLNNYYWLTNGPQVLVAQKGFLFKYVNTTKFWQLPCMILEEGSKSVVAGKIETTVSAGLDSSVGAFVRPV